MACWELHHHRNIHLEKYKASMHKKNEQRSVFFNFLKRRFRWMDIYFIAVTVAYIAWRGVIFLKKIL